MELIASIGWRVIPTVGPLSPHGIGIAVGYGLGGLLVARRAERPYGIERQHIWNMLTWAVLGVVVGSRLFYVAGHLDQYLPDPLEIVRVWNGGLVFYGGAFGGILAAVPYMRAHRLSFWQVMDAAAPGFPLGLIFGRIGDLVIGDHLGGPTSLPWGFRYEGGALPGCPSLPDSGVSCPLLGEVVHQTALYDLVNALLLFAVVMWIGKRRQRFDGFLILLTGAWYAVGRFAGDFARSAVLYAGLRGTQWVSVALFAVSVVMMLRRARAPRPYDQPTEEDEARAEAMLAEGAPIPSMVAHSPPAIVSPAPQHDYPPREPDTESAADDMVAEGGPLSTSHGHRTAPPPPDEPAGGSGSNGDEHAP